MTGLAPLNDSPLSLTHRTIIRGSSATCSRACASSGGGVSDAVIVRRSKTQAGAGRVIPLTRRVCSTLTLWLSRFTDAGQDAFVFPFHNVRFAGYDRKPHIWSVDHTRPMSTYSYK